MTRERKRGREKKVLPCSKMLLCHVSHSVLFDSLRPHGLEPTRLLCPWNSPGKNTGVGSHALLQGISPIQGLNSGLLHCRQILYCLSYPGNPLVVKCQLINYKCSGGEAYRKSLPGWWLFQIGIINKFWSRWVEAYGSTGYWLLWNTLL